MNKIYEEVTNQIISMMEQGIIPWHKPWTGTRSGAISHSTGRPYSLLNQILLQIPGEYITWNQCHQEGGHVKKGAKAKHVYFWKLYLKPAVNEDGEPELDDEGKQKMKKIPVLKSFMVFHIDDCEGIEPKWADKLPEAPAQPIEEAEKTLMAYISREKITLEAEYISNRAYYSPAFDKIVLPRIDQFSETAEYYSTAFHEATHSTGHPKRLNRFALGGKDAAFGSEEYSKEELVAEIGAACILHQMGIGTPSSLKNSAAYVQGWLNALKNDKQLIIGAAARAEKAVMMILGKAEEATEE